MAGSPDLVITAGLQEKATVNTIREQLNNVVAPQLNGVLKINCTINTDNIQALQQQLNSISNNLNLNIGNINVSQNATNGINALANNVQAQANNIQNQTNRITQSLADVASEFVKPLDVAGFFDSKGFLNAGSVIQEFQKRFEELGNVTVKGFYNNIEKQDSISRIVATVRSATGEIKNFNFVLDRTEKIFNYASSQFDNKGIQQQVERNIKAIDEYTSKLATLRRDANNFVISVALPDNTIATLDTLQQKINGLRNGTSSIEEVSHLYTALNSEMKSMTAIARAGQGKALDPLANAVISAREFDNTLKAIKVDIDSLSTKNKGNLSATYQELSNAYTKLQGTPERTKEWLELYTQLAVNIRTVQGEIKLAKKLEREDSSSEIRKTLAYLEQVKQAYADIKSNSVALNKSGLTEKQQAFYSANIQEADKRLNDAIQSLSTEKLITQEVQEQLNNYRNRDAVLQQSLALERERVALQQTQNQTLSDISDTNTISKLNSDIDKLSQKISELNNAYGNQNGLFSRVASIRQEISRLNNIDTTTKAGQIQWNGQLVNINEQMRTLVLNINNAKNAESNLTQEANKANSTIRDYIKALQSFNNSAVARNNSANADVQSQTSTNTGLISQLQALQNSLSADSSAANFSKIRTELDSLIPSLDNARASSESLNATLRNNNDLAAREARLKSLQNQIEIFARANATAVNSTNVMKSGTTFADEFKRIQDLANSKNLDNNAIRRLTEDFRNFKSEAKSVGMTTNKFFTDMGSQLKMVVSRWVSLYAIIGKLRTMINYVVELDTAMINLKRVTTATAEEYEKFLENAANVAQQTNTQLSDVVAQSARWAKAGFGLDELSDVSDASLVYSIVGDVDNETAVNDLVTALKGFRLEASETMSIVNKLDILNNKYATDAKSLGEALAVSSSAMAESGNTLDQTLALITGGSEITQNAKEMGNALKVVSMRIRGMKGKLEELGEESEGIESISKVQTQILNLTKGAVNIFDDEGKFRGTYEILEDISKVIDKLSDPDRANLTEVLFGKMRGNQGLAVLSAFQSGQISKALNDAQNSAGTALEEMDRYSTSVTAHITNFKSSVQKLSNEMFNSDFLKFWIDFGKNAVNALSWTGEKLNFLSGGFKESEEGLIGVKTALASLVGVIASFKGANYGKTIANLFKPSAISGISKDDVAALRNYNALIAQGVPMEQAHAQALNQASVGAQRLATNANGAAVSERLLADAENKVTFATKALNVAVNAFVNIVITLLISAAISALAKLVDKMITTKAESEEMVNSVAQSMQELADSNKELAESSKELDDLVSQYAQLVASTDDMSTVKTELQSIQDSLIDKFGKEAAAIDLLNDKYSDTIKKIRELSEAEYKEWKRQNTDKIEEAKRQQEAYISQESFYDPSTYNPQIKTYEYHNPEQLSDEILALYTLKDVSREVTKEAKNIKGIFRTKAGISDTLMLSGSLKDAEEQVIRLIRQYKQVENFDKEQLSALQDRYNKLHEININSAEMLQQLQEREQQEALNNTIDEKQFDNLIDKAVELNQAIQGDGTATEKFSAYQQLKDVESELYEIAGESTEYQDIIKNIFGAFESGTESAVKSVDDLRSQWYASLEDVQKEQLKNIDKMKSALQSLADGEKLSSDDFWELSKLDTSGLLKDIKMIGNEFVLNEEELIKMKDTYIKKIIRQLEAQKQAAQTELDGIKNLEYEELKLQKIVEKGINSSADEKRYKEQNEIVKQIKSNMKAYGDEIARNDLLIKTLNASLGDTVDLSEAMTKNIDKQIDSLEKQIKAEEEALKAQTKEIDSQIKDLQNQIKAEENTLKSQEKEIDSQIKGLQNQIKAEEQALKEQEKAIDNEIDSLENEKKIHEEIKEDLESQLETLEKQKDEIEQIISNYETVASLVEKTTQTEIDTLKEQQEEIKNYYDEQINALQEIHDKKEEENTLAEKQLALQKALKELEDARNNRSVRTYSSAQGWHYEVDKEAVINAEKNVADAQKSLNEYNSEQEYKNSIKALEEERDANVAVYDDKIKAYEEYIKQWQDILEKEKNTENERLANELLGLEWREKIKDKDLEILSTFDKEFSSYNSKLKNLVDVEITSLEKSIEAKENEIKEIDKAIQVQKDYKAELQEASKSVTDSLNEQIDSLEAYKSELQEASKSVTDSLNEQVDALNEYKDTLERDTEAITSKWQEQVNALNEYKDNLADVEKKINTSYKNISTNAWSAVANQSAAVEEMKGNVKDLKDYTEQSLTEMRLSRILDELFEDDDSDFKHILGKVWGLPGYSSGGVVSGTGVAMLHGKKTAAETVFNAEQAKELYNMVKTGDFANLVADKAIQGISSQTGTGIVSNHNSNSNSIAVNINKIVTDNPQDFVNQLDVYLNKYMSGYWQNKLTQDYTQS